MLEFSERRQKLLAAMQDAIAQRDRLLADEILDVMPEMVGSRRGKLDETDAEETDIQTLDTSNVTLALVNAVKELAARVAALETR